MIGRRKAAVFPLVNKDGMPEKATAIYRELKKHFKIGGGMLRNRAGQVLKAVDGVSFTVEPGKTLGIVGESGCGKSVTNLTIMGLNPRTAVVSGEALFRGEDLIKASSKRLREVRADVEPTRTRTAAEPFDAAADGEVDVELGEVEGNDARRLVAVQNDVRAHLVRAAHDGLDVLDLRVLEEHVTDRHEQRALVDRLDDRPVVFDRDDVKVRLRLVQVAHRREVRLFVDDAVADAGPSEAGQDDLLGDGDVLVHHRAAGRSADDGTRS